MDQNEFYIQNINSKGISISISAVKVNVLMHVLNL